MNPESSSVIDWFQTLIVRHGYSGIVFVSSETCKREVLNYLSSMAGLMVSAQKGTVSFGSLGILNVRSLPCYDLKHAHHFAGMQFEDIVYTHVVTPQLSGSFVGFMKGRLRSTTGNPCSEVFLPATTSVIKGSIGNNTNMRQTQATDTYKYIFGEGVIRDIKIEGELVFDRDPPTLGESCRKEDCNGSYLGIELTCNRCGDKG